MVPSSISISRSPTRRTGAPDGTVGFPTPTFLVLVPREVVDSLYMPAWIFGATFRAFFVGGNEDIGL